MSAPTTKRRRVVENKKRRRRDSKSENSNEKRQKDLTHFYADDEVLIKVNWERGQCQERLNHAAMFDNSRAKDAIKVDVWGAPFDLYISKQLLSLECSRLDDLLDGDTLRIARYTVLSICNQNEDVAHEFWMAVWNYVSLLCGLAIASVDSCSCVITTKRPAALSPTHCIYLLAFTDFLCERVIRNLIIESMSMGSTGFSMTSKRILYTGHRSTAMTGNILAMYCKQALLLDVNKYTGVFNTLFAGLGSYYRMLNSDLCPEVVEFLYSMLTHKKFFQRATKLLDAYECSVYDPNALGRYSSKHRAFIDTLFVSLDANLWNIMQTAQLLCNNDSGKIIYSEYRRPGESLCRSYDLAVSRLQCYWSFIFQDAPESLTDCLALSGSTLPMCCLSFKSPVFRVAVSSLFAEADVDVYITNTEQPQQLLSSIESYLSQKHEHMWKQSENSRTLENSDLVLTSVTYVIHGHPLFKQNHSLQIQFMYFSSKSGTPLTIDAKQCVLRHHLCPVRAYFNPKDGIMIAPSAFISWTTGYMRYYRGFDAKEEVATSCVFKYVQRCFGVFVDEQQKHGCEYSKKLLCIAKKVLEALPEDIRTPLATGKLREVFFCYDKLLCIKYNDGGLNDCTTQPLTSAQRASILNDKGVY